MEYDVDYIRKLAYDNGVKFIRLWFTDILGFLKSFAITIEELDDALAEGVRFDGSTLLANARDIEQEMIAMPDPSTFQILPWRPHEDAVARMFCDIYTMDMEHYSGDSRYILKKAIDDAAKEGYIYYTGPEIEFFLFKNSKSPELLDNGGYFDLTPLDLASDLRRELVLTLENMEVDVISSHHEASPSQHEIDLRHSDALTTADNIMTFRLIAKEVAQLNDVYASFMPKPIGSINGSGMHIHQSLYKNDENLFFDKNNKLYLSDTAKQFIAGQLRHSSEFFALTNQWINSYKRLQYGYESPVKSTWSQTDPASLIRIPQHRKEKPDSTRIELRNPDASCNPYLAFAAMLRAGLEGIRNNYSLPDTDGGEMSEEQLMVTGDNRLPVNLLEALQSFHGSELMKDILGDYIHKKFILNKLHELKEYNNSITDFEIESYFHRL
jgi:glutamine synthetase